MSFQDPTIDYAGLSPVPMAVWDSGVDFGIDALGRIAWVNDREVPGNGKDDDGLSAACARPVSVPGLVPGHCPACAILSSRAAHPFVRVEWRGLTSLFPLRREKG